MTALGIAALVAGLSLSAQERVLVDKEAALGAMLARNFEQQATVLPNAAFDKYMERVGRRLSAQLPPDQHEYTFALVADEGLARNPLHEAASFPGGYIFVPASLVLTASDEQEFVKRIAHAMAHIAERHAAYVAKRVQGANQATVPTVYVGGSFGLGGPDAMVPFGLRKAMQDYELAAAKLTEHMLAGLPTDPFNSPDEFLQVQRDVRAMVPAARRAPSLRDPQ